MNYLKEMADQGYNTKNIGPFHRAMVPWLMHSYSISRDETIVDIGAGQGHCLIPLIEAGWRKLIAVDADNFNFELFRSKYAFSTMKCDISHEKLRLENGVAAAVMCFHLIEHIANPHNLLSEIFRILKPEGVVFVVTPDWRKQYKTFYRDPTHIKPYDKESLSRLLRIYKFDVQCFSWGSLYGLGRILAYRYFPRLGLIGKDMLAIGTK
jgi:2-polyprenyl-3-methyl-5-hydroxy-6-metoxy-1,4-benzoquinol methylase